MYDFKIILVFVFWVNHDHFGYDASMHLNEKFLGISISI
jgi:hypothetical protein